MLEKICCVCKKSLPLDSFYVNKSKKDGKHTRCITCDKARGRAYHKNNLEKRRITTARYREKNPLMCWAMSCISSHRHNGYKILFKSKELANFAVKITDCFYCGKKLNWEPKRKMVRHDSPSVDRINNEIEMRIDNIVICCSDCNTTKNAKNLTQFLEYCSLICRRFGGAH